jgi:cell wall-associated NlpC family hydrolase
MPNLLRSPLLALAVAALAFTCTASAGSSDRDATPSAVTAPLVVTDSVAKPRVKHRRVKRHKRKQRTLGDRAARIALRAVGVPYRWGGTSPSGGFDCSGLIYWAYGKLGIDVPHSSYALADTGRRVGTRHLKAGDVLIFSGYGHVGLYIGRGRMVHAPQSGRLVEIVHLARSYYADRIVTARRVTSR